MGRGLSQRGSSPVPRPTLIKPRAPLPRGRAPVLGCGPVRADGNIPLGQGETTLHAGALAIHLKLSIPLIKKGNGGGNKSATTTSLMTHGSLYMLLKVKWRREY